MVFYSFPSQHLWNMDGKYLINKGKPRGLWLIPRFEHPHILSNSFMSDMIVNTYVKPLLGAVDIPLDRTDMNSAL